MVDCSHITGVPPLPRSIFQNLDKTMVLLVLLLVVSLRSIYIVGGPHGPIEEIDC